MSSGYYLTSGFFYINLGAHMIYILRNRLQAQNIRKQKIIRILEDISGAVFKENFITQLLLPQDPLNTNTLKYFFDRFRGIFAKLAHCSIMKLDATSMDKMFYLMLLSVKKEIFLTSSPLQLYTLTLSHLLNLVKYLQAENVPYLEFAITQFQKAASRYSFIQYLEIKEYMLSELEKYQTKIVNFIDAGCQDHNGKMIFRVRNSHNQKSIGSATNQPDQDCPFTQVKPQNQLLYQNWLTWKSSLVIDFVQDYKKSSIKRNTKPPISSTQQGNNQKEKSLGDMFNLKFDDLDNFEVKFDMFASQSETNSSNIEQIKQSQDNSKKVTKPSSNLKNANSFKSQIEKQFAELKFQKKEQEQEEPDLLDMMDN